jgi:hypothetical protein
MSWVDVRRSAAWTPYGGPLNEELPDEEFAHWRCWKAATDADRSLIRRIAWIPVSHLGKLA